MGFRFRKGINLGKGFRINLSKSGIGYSIGGKGFRYTKKANGGYRETYSIPGTGLSWIKEHGKSKNSNQSLQEDNNVENNSVNENEIDKQYLYSIENNISTSADIRYEAFLQAIRNFIKLNYLFSFIVILLFIVFIISLNTTIDTVNIAYFHYFIFL